ncbi:MAG: cytochrome c [Myxococcota bacterium]
MRYGWIAAAFLAAGCNGGAEDDRVTLILDLEGDPANGATVYTGNCALCHMESGLGTNDPTPGSGPDLTEVAAGNDDVALVEVILSGKEAMPAFDSLADQDIADLVAYIHDGLF